MNKVKAKRRTNLDRNLDTVHQLTERWDCIFRRARERQLSHTQILALRQSEIFSHPRWKYLTTSDVEYVRGYADALFKRQWELVRWELRNGNAIITENYGDASRAGTLTGAHVYIAAPHNEYTERKHCG